VLIVKETMYANFEVFAACILELEGKHGTEVRQQTPEYIL